MTRLPGKSLVVAALIALMVIVAGCDVPAQVLLTPSPTECLEAAQQSPDVTIATCQSPSTPTEVKPTQAQTPAQATPAATKLLKLPTAASKPATATVFLPVVQASEPATPEPTATAVLPTIAAPTPTLGATTAPTVNQLGNPCFDGIHNDDPPGWQQTPGWDVSMHKNPCGANGTAARINDPQQAGESGPDTDERIWQVVTGQGPYLVAEMQCVHHFAYYADMNIYGGASPNGPWSLVWKPFTLADCDKDRWGAAVRHAETRLPQGYAYYKVEFATMYALVGPDSGGVKFTSAYFASGK